MGNKKAFLVLQDGSVYEGLAIGKEGTTTGEIAFNTGMTGYQEVFTDPSYLGQLLIMTTPHIGNYGVNSDETESSSMRIAGLITKKFSNTYSRDDSSGSLQDYMFDSEVVGISDVDTRSLVRHIRTKGAMNAVISSEITEVDQLIKMAKEIPSMEGLELSSQVSTKEMYVVGEADAPYRVALLDYGVKTNIIRCLTTRGCQVFVFPMTATLEEISVCNPHGIMLSNGPGDPSSMTQTIQQVKTYVDGPYPIFGICLGHQILALSQGLKTVKMHNGHRGLNHPVKNLLTGKGEITSQNHGFVVTKESCEENDNIQITHSHLNDGSVAGIQFLNKPIFSVQYHPEASAGPHDSRYLFDQFITNMKPTTS